MTPSARAAAIADVLPRLDWNGHTWAELESLITAAITAAVLAEREASDAIRAEVILACGAENTRLRDALRDIAFTGLTMPMEVASDVHFASRFYERQLKTCIGAAAWALSPPSLCLCGHAFAPSHQTPGTECSACEPFGSCGSFRSRPSPHPEAKP